MNAYSPFNSATFAATGESYATSQDVETLDPGITGIDVVTEPGKTAALDVLGAELDADGRMSLHLSAPHGELTLSPEVLKPWPR